ncbi:MAG: acylphosphatase [Acidobacteria bacterium]|nr:acylphosphatase [Acidobacteriota bacterium]
MADTLTRLFLVSGRVQGVYFRAFVRQHALPLGLTGYAKNLADGRVEVLATGSPEAVDTLRGHLHVGPRLSDVRQVEEREAAPTKRSGFEIR